MPRMNARVLSAAQKYVDLSQQMRMLNVALSCHAQCCYTSDVAFHFCSCEVEFFSLFLLKVPLSINQPTNQH